MAKASHSITPDKLAGYNIDALDNLRANALRLGADDVVRLCDEELAKRPPRKTKISRQQGEHISGDVVTGYHFVCSRNRGVTEAGGGRFWSGSWVVAERNVQESLRYGAYLALHESKADFSYRQGQLVDYREASREMVAKFDDGIEFLIQETPQRYQWIGNGAGEKGYRWEKLARKHAQSSPE